MTKLFHPPLLHLLLLFKRPSADDKKNKYDSLSHISQTPTTTLLSE